MTTYDVFVDPVTEKLIVNGNFMPGSIAVKIPNEKKVAQFTSYFLHKADIEAGIDYLTGISLNNHIKVNEGLFIAALTMLMKCFQSSESRGQLNEDAFKKFAPEVAECFDKYKNWRNKHFVHDVNSMIETTAFLLIAPEPCEEIFGGDPSVVWNRVPVDYLVESRSLYNVMQCVWQFIVSKIDEIGTSIHADYRDKSKDELLQFERANIKLATTISPEQKR